MGDREGGREASVVEENPGGDCQVVGGGVESLRETDTPGVKLLPRDYKTSGVTLKGKRVPIVDKQEKGGDGNSPATRDNEGISNNSCEEETEIDR